MAAIQNDQSARRSSLINQPTVASLEQPRRKSAIARFIGDINSELEKVGHRLYCQRIEQASGWVDGRRICNEGSPPVVAFRTKLVKREIFLPKVTKICIHLEKVPQEEENPDKIFFTTQGTLTEQYFQEPLMRLIQTHFTIDSESVIRGANHEDDYIHGSKISEIANLRTEKNDRSATVKQTQPVHRLKTNHFGKVKPKYDLEDLEKPLSEVLRPMTEADNAVWNDRANLEMILNSGVTPNFLCNQYAERHKWQLTRMAHNLQMSPDKQRLLSPIAFLEAQ